MTAEEFHSSDKAISSETSSYMKVWPVPSSISLELGDKLDNVEIAYETYGKLNKEKSNAVLICHALSGDSHVASHSKEDIEGWWEIFVGPGKSIDTNKYFVICSNVLGSCRGTTGPNSINQNTGKPFGKNFPLITVGDMVKVQKLLVNNALNIENLLCVVGGSLGGFQVLEWAKQYPSNVKGCIGIATSSRLSPQALAFDVVGRNAITHDPNFKDGKYYDKDSNPEDGLAIARMLGHITYLSNDSMNKKFGKDKLKPREIKTDFEKRFSVGTYLAYQGRKFVERFDANSYITLTTAMDLFSIGENKEEIEISLKNTNSDWLFISFSSDWLYPPDQSKELVEALISSGKNVSYTNIPSKVGHDAFLLEDELEDYGNLTSAFLNKLTGDIEKTIHSLKPSQREKTNIFYNKRLDLNIVADLVPKNSAVLDLGCEDGDLLSLLREKGFTELIGIEIDYKKVETCANKSLTVINYDIEEGLKTFSNKKFDVAILSQTLQAIKNVEKVIVEMTRVAKASIISFPNFAYKPLREMMFQEGKAPKSEGWYGYDWYNTPNKRFPSIADFEDFCNLKNILILRSIFLNSEKGIQITEEPNLNADNAIFVLGESTKNSK